MSETVNAVDAPMMAMTSYGLVVSDESGVMIIWTSFLKSFGNSGLIGRSVSLAISTECVVGLPSRLKKLPGIFPLAYSLSSTSTVSGKKSIPSLGDEVVAVTSRTLSWYLTTTEPFACCASLPDSNESVPFPTSRTNGVVINLNASYAAEPIGRRKHP